MIIMNSPKFKICCIQNSEEANLAISYGAYAIGLVSEMPSGPGMISEDKIKQIAETVPKSLKTFLLTSKQESKDIIWQLKRCKTNTVQIVDRLTSGSYNEIRDALPEIKIVQVIHVLDNNSIDEAISISEEVDALLLDSGNPELNVKELGGTGRTHNWELSRTIRESVDLPVYLAGGLNPGNIAEAIKSVKPFGVDVCSGVRTNGKLDEEKLAEFVNQIKQVNVGLCQ
ncbi:N-(5'-phosphoribosyl)anthranilate isomerase [bacterium BMS3Abin03]|nr:N-(5'-phosphoribosyl)anthranilate isomerase [bacterium BMS3Abin03]